MNRKLLFSILLLFASVIVSQAQSTFNIAQLKNVPDKTFCPGVSRLRSAIEKPGKFSSQLLRANSNPITMSDEVLLEWDFNSLLDGEVPEDWLTDSGESNFYLYDFDGYTNTWTGEALPWYFVLDPDGSENVVLLSQSWYTEDINYTYYANDWFVTAPFEVPDNSNIYEASWESKAFQGAPYNPGYDFGIIEDDNFLQIIDVHHTSDALFNNFLLKTTFIFSNTDTGENTEWTRHVASLDAFKGKKVRMVFRNRFQGPNAVMLNYVSAHRKENYSLESSLVSEPVFPYGQIPAFLTAEKYPVSVKYKLLNTGSQSLTNVNTTVTLYNKNDKPVDIQKVFIAVLESEKSVTDSVTFLTNVALEPESYYVTVKSVANEGNVLTYIETVDYEGIIRSVDVFARDNGILSDAFMVNSTSDSYSKRIGVIYELEKKVVLNAVEFYLLFNSAEETTVRVLSAKIQNGNLSLSEKANADVTLEPNATAPVGYTVNFEEAVVLNPGTYWITLDEPPLKAIGLVSTTNNTGFSSILTIDSYNWFFEDFTFYLRMILQDPSNTGIEDDVASKSIAVSTTPHTFELSYPAGFSTVSAYDTSGKLLASYDLPFSGLFSLPSSGLNKGIYLLRFSGDGVSQSVKVIK